MNKIQDPGTQQKIQAAIHALHLQDHLTQVMAEHAPVSAKAPRASYISEGAWTIREKKGKLKARLRARRMTFIQIFCQHAVVDFWRPKALITRDKIGGLQDLVNDFGYMKFDGILSALKRAGIGQKNKSALLPPKALGDWRPHGFWQM